MHPDRISQTSQGFYPPNQQITDLVERLVFDIMADIKLELESKVKQIDNNIAEIRFHIRSLTPTLSLVDGLSLRIDIIEQQISALKATEMVRPHSRSLKEPKKSSHTADILNESPIAHTHQSPAKAVQYLLDGSLTFSNSSNMPLELLSPEVAPKATPFMAEEQLHSLNIPNAKKKIQPVQLKYQEMEFRPVMNQKPKSVVQKRQRGKHSESQLPFGHNQSEFRVRGQSVLEKGFVRTEGEKLVNTPNYQGSRKKVQQPSFGIKESSRSHQSLQSNISVQQKPQEFEWGQSHHVQESQPFNRISVNTVEDMSAKSSTPVFAISSSIGGPPTNKQGFSPSNSTLSQVEQALSRNKNSFLRKAKTQVGADSANTIDWNSLNSVNSFNNYNNNVAASNTARSPPLPAHIAVKPSDTILEESLEDSIVQK